MGGGVSGSSEGGGMRHRFHSICPYFAMFPETFVEKHLAASLYQGVVFDPFCGRGTAVFQTLLQDRVAAGSDVNPVAVCIAGAKCDPPEQSNVEARLLELREEFCAAEESGWNGAYADFFGLCFHRDTLPQILHLRSVLDWRRRKDDRFIAALCLGALHGESHRSPNCFSNRMPRTISAMVAKERVHAAAAQCVRDSRTDDRVSVPIASSESSGQRSRVRCEANR